MSKEATVVATVNNQMPDLSTNVTEIVAEAKALLIVEALECYASGHWRWMTMEPMKRLHAAWIGKRYQELLPGDFKTASERARVEFVKAIITDDPALRTWVSEQRIFTCSKCNTDTIAAATSITCACGNVESRGRDVAQEARQVVLLQYWLGEVSEGWAASLLAVDRLQIREETINLFGSLHYEGDADEEPSTN